MTFEVKQRNNAIEIHNNDNIIAWNGPLYCLVNIPNKLIIPYELFDRYNLNDFDTYGSKFEEYFQAFLPTHLENICNTYIFNEFNNNPDMVSY